MADSGIKERTLEIRFENHRFSPLSLTVPADTPLQVRVLNLSHERIEFESFGLDREKVVNPGGVGDPEAARATRRQL